MGKRAPKLIAFDMDGVLIDVSRSYRDTVRQTAEVFLRPAMGAERLPQPLFRLADLAVVKQSGGLNNDWDLTHRVLSLLFTGVECADGIPPMGGWQGYQRTIGSCDVRPLAAYLNTTDRPLQTLMRTHARRKAPFVDRMYRGDVGSGNVIKQMFQEIYLGRALFGETYAMPCRLDREEGFIRRETLFPEPDALVRLARDNLLAVATGRPRSEAAHPLSRFGLTGLFRTVITLDDCLAEEARRMEKTGTHESLGKPHPYMLDALAAAIDEPVAARVYVGDMPDDMQAAARSQAEFIGIGMTVSAADKPALRDRLLRAGAAVVVDDFGALEDALSRIP